MAAPKAPLLDGTGKKSKEEKVERAKALDVLRKLDLERYARMRTPGIRDDGRAKVLAGVTTIEEVLKVTRED